VTSVWSVPFSQQGSHTEQATCRRRHFDPLYVLLTTSQLIHLCGMCRWRFTCSTGPSLPGGMSSTCFKQTRQQPVLASIQVLTGGCGSTSGGRVRRTSQVWWTLYEQETDITMSATLADSTSCGGRTELMRRSGPLMKAGSMGAAARASPYALMSPAKHTLRTMRWMQYFVDAFDQHCERICGP
jgi:hypothetical protein